MDGRVRGRDATGQEHREDSRGRLGKTERVVHGDEGVDCDALANGGRRPVVDLFSTSSVSACQALQGGVKAASTAPHGGLRVVSGSRQDRINPHRACVLDPEADLAADLNTLTL